MTRKLHVIGNWKMHGSKEHVETFFSSLKSKAQTKPSWLEAVEAAICPPFVYLDQAAQYLASIPEFKLGAQEVCGYEQGAFTGQIAATMLKEIGCRYVIVGHSERRQFCQESDEEIAKKFFAAKLAGLTPILCVGETEEQRHQGLMEKVVLSQVQAILAVKGPAAFEEAMIAYEPIWAIGTGVTATPQQAQEVHHLLRSTLAEYDAHVAERLPILYGGSVKPNNAVALFSMPDIDGALVGGASLQAPDFLAICEAVGKLTA